VTVVGAASRVPVFCAMDLRGGAPHVDTCDGDSQSLECSIPTVPLGCGGPVMRGIWAGQSPSRRRSKTPRRSSPEFSSDLGQEVIQLRVALEEERAARVNHDVQLQRCFAELQDIRTELAKPTLEALERKAKDARFGESAMDSGDARDGLRKSGFDRIAASDIPFGATAQGGQEHGAQATLRPAIVEEKYGNAEAGKFLGGICADASAASDGSAQLLSQISQQIQGLESEVASLRTIVANCSSAVGIAVKEVSDRDSAVEAVKAAVEGLTTMEALAGEQQRQIDAMDLKVKKCADLENAVQHLSRQLAEVRHPRAELRSFSSGPVPSQHFVDGVRCDQASRASSRPPSTPPHHCAATPQFLRSPVISACASTAAGPSAANLARIGSGAPPPPTTVQAVASAQKFPMVVGSISLRTPAAAPSHATWCNRGLLESAQGRSGKSTPVAAIGATSVHSVRCHSPNHASAAAGGAATRLPSPAVRLPSPCSALVRGTQLSPSTLASAATLANHVKVPVCVPQGTVWGPPVAAGWSTICSNKAHFPSKQASPSNSPRGRMAEAHTRQEGFSAHMRSPTPGRIGGVVSRSRLQ